MSASRSESRFSGIAEEAKKRKGMPSESAPRFLSKSFDAMVRDDADMVHVPVSSTGNGQAKHGNNVTFPSGRGRSQARYSAGHKYKQSHGEYGAGSFELRIATYPSNLYLPEHNCVLRAQFLLYSGWTQASMGSETDNNDEDGRASTRISHRVGPISRRA